MKVNELICSCRASLRYPLALIAIMFLGSSLSAFDGTDADNTSNEEFSLYKIQAEELYIEAECSTFGINYSIVNDNSVSNSNYLESDNTSRFNSAPSGSSDDILTFDFTLSESGTYRFWGLIRTFGGSSDSYWVRVDGGSWIKWNGISLSNWAWVQVFDSDNGNANVELSLSAGAHTLEFSHREPGVIIDKIYITNTTNTPTGLGGTAPSCTIPVQVDFTEIPSDKRLYARNTSTNLATVDITGEVNIGSPSYTELRVKVYRSGSLQTTLTESLTYSASKAPFSLSYDITAELANYKFEIYGYDGSTEILVREIDEVVAGDIFIIQGQSNAEAKQRTGSDDANVNQSNFIRSFGSGNDDWASVNQTWFEAEGNGDRTTNGNAGQWGLKLAKDIVDEYSIPIAIFNGAHGGKEVSFFQRNDGDPDNSSTNYGRMYRRLELNSLRNEVRAIIWHQGEEDAEQGTSLATYKTRFTDLYNDWMSDYSNLEEIYIFQIRNGCGSSIDDVNNIKEAQRQLAEELSNLTIMSTTAIPHMSDNCHYLYQNGYEEFADRIYRLIRRDLYGASNSSNIAAPDISQAFFSDVDEVTIVTKDPSDVLTWDSGAENDFEIEGSTITITSGTVSSGNRLILQLSAVPSGSVGINYQAHAGSSGPWVTNSNGIGLLSFFNFTVSPSSLPVEWLSFDGQVEDQGIKLEWVTALEIENDFFSIERRNQDEDWQPIGKVKGQGTTDSPTSYSFVDNNPANGSNVYRIRQVDFDGGFDYSRQIEVSFLSEDLTVYPNPTYDKINISGVTDLKFIQIELFSTTGQLLKSEIKKLNGSAYNINLDISELPEGNYILRVDNRKSRIITKW